MITWPTLKRLRFLERERIETFKQLAAAQDDLQDALARLDRQQALNADLRQSLRDEETRVSILAQECGRLRMERDTKDEVDELCRKVEEGRA